MADKSVRMEVIGIRELQRAFKDMGDGMEKAIKEEFLPIARAIANSAQAKAPGSSGHSIKPKSSNRGASISFGGSREPEFPWLDFGGSVGRGHQQGRPWSGAIKREWKGVPNGSGRYVYPTITEYRDETRQGVDAAIERLAKRASFETHGKV